MTLLQITMISLEITMIFPLLHMQGGWG